MRDPILKLIGERAMDGAAYDCLASRAGSEEVLAEAWRDLVGRHDLALATFVQPITTRAGAAAAIQVALDDIRDAGETLPIVEAMLAAVARYLADRN